MSDKDSTEVGSVTEDTSSQEVVTATEQAAVTEDVVTPEKAAAEPTAVFLLPDVLFLNTLSPKATLKSPVLVVGLILLLPKATLFESSQTKSPSVASPV